ncbi:hypothetical protein PG989_015745 [Apiospora arundinis]
MPRIPRKTAADFLKRVRRLEKEEEWAEAFRHFWSWGVGIAGGYVIYRFRDLDRQVKRLEDYKLKYMEGDIEKHKKQISELDSRTSSLKKEEMKWDLMSKVRDLEREREEQQQQQEEKRQKEERERMASNSESIKGTIAGWTNKSGPH